MPRSVCALAVLAFVSSSAPAGEKEARAILDRAIKAQGGADALKKAVQLRRTDKGTQVLLGRDLPFTSQVVRSLPERVRLKIELGKFTTTVVLDGDRGWQSDGGPAVALGLPRVRELQEEAYVQWVATLVPLLGPGFTLSALPKTKVGDESAVGIKVVRRGKAEVRLYFLERNGLLAKIETKGSKAGVAVDKEYLLSGYKEFEGIKLPTKELVKINGNKETEFTISDYDFPAKLEPGTFGKP
jgi:hypothetical protein